MREVRLVTEHQFLIYLWDRLGVSHSTLRHLCKLLCLHQLENTLSCNWSCSEHLPVSLSHGWSHLPTMKEALCTLEDEQEKVTYVKNTPLQFSTITIKTWCQVQKRKTDLSWQKVSTLKSNQFRLTMNMHVPLRQERSESFHIPASLQTKVSVPTSEYALSQLNWYWDPSK